MALKFRNIGVTPMIGRVGDSRGSLRRSTAATPVTGRNL